MNKEHGFYSNIRAIKIAPIALAVLVTPQVNAQVNCASPQVTVLTAGIDDNFVLPAEAVNIGANFLGNNCPVALQVDFDTLTNDRRVCHTFENLPPNIIAATLEIRAQAATGGSSNDGINLDLTDPATGGGIFAWSRRFGPDGSITGLSTTPWFTGVTELFTLDLAALPNQTGPDTNILTSIGSDHALDIIVADDTGVDFAKLTVTHCPPVLGLEQNPLGQAQLDDDGSGNLVVSNIGSSGLDGVSIQLGETEGGSALFTELASATVGSTPEVKFDFKDSSNTTEFSLSFQGGASSPGETDLVFTSIGTSAASEMQVDLYNNSILVGTLGKLPIGSGPTATGLGPFFKWLFGGGNIKIGGSCETSKEFFENGQLKSKSKSYTADFETSIGGGVDVTDPSDPSGNTTITINELVFTPINIVSSGLPLTHIDVTASDISEIGFNDIAVKKFDFNNRATGTPSLTALTDESSGINTLVVSNIGSSGLDGVSIDLGGTGNFETTLLNLDPGLNLPVGAFLTANATGTANGVADQPLGSITITDTGSVLQTTADFSVAGSTTQRIEIYNADVLVSTVSGHTGPSIETVSWPDRIGKRGGLPPILSCFTQHFPSQQLITVPGNPGVMGDEVRILAEGGDTVSSLASLVLNASDIPQFTITNHVGDADADGVFDDVDNCEITANANQLDTDSDSAGNVCDDDDDGDNLSDDDEINIYGTNPLLEDTDGDTFNDGVEIAAGSNPLDINSTPTVSAPALSWIGLLGLLTGILGFGVKWSRGKR